MGTTMHNNINNDRQRQWLMLSVFVVFAYLLVFLQPVDSCNEAVCGSIVSKCLLTQSCKCDLVNCTCCKECFNCLSYLYSDCCSCVDMCPQPNDTNRKAIADSQIGEFEDDAPGLFQALTGDHDNLERWTSITFPVDFPIDIKHTQYAPKKEVKYQMQSVEMEQEVLPFKQNITTLNCTVAYMSQCMSWKKCKDTCQSMGAASYRWFLDGCCECVGRTCIKNGLNESRCKKCSHLELGEEEDIEDYDNMDYGEDEEDDTGNVRS